MARSENEQVTAHATTANLGFLLAKASARWNEELAAAFAARGFPEISPSYGSVLLPLFEEDGLRMGDLARRARLPKQTLTTLTRPMERDGLVERHRDPDDARAWRVHLTDRAHAVRDAAEDVLAALEARVAEHLTRETTETLRAALRRVMEI
jgi:MarR family transcriptional regulator, organic hydroperoxide resistance regulator